MQILQKCLHPPMARGRIAMKIQGFRPMSVPVRTTAPQGTKSTGKVFAIKSEGVSNAAAPAPQARVQKSESSLTVAMRSIASDFKAGRIENRQEAVRKMVSTMLSEQFGKKVTGSRGFAQVEQSISELLSDDPHLSQRMESLLQKLA
jgi:hypothetical protein